MPLSTWKLACSLGAWMLLNQKSTAEQQHSNCVFPKISFQISFGCFWSLAAAVYLDETTTRFFTHCIALWLQAAFQISGQNLWKVQLMGWIGILRRKASIHRVTFPLDLIVPVCLMNTRTGHLGSSGLVRLNKFGSLVLAFRNVA